MDFEPSSEQNPKANKTKSRMTLLAMAAVFIAPVALAYLAYFGGWFQGGGKSHGEIISDPWHIDDLAEAKFSFGPWQESTYFAKWNWLLVIDANQCDETCQMNWIFLQQTHKGMGKYVEKIGYLLLLNQEMKQWPEGVAKIDFATAQMNQGAVEINSDKLHGLNASAMPANAIYLMDPMGNIFMRYALITEKEQAPLKSRDFRTDITRVMRVLDTHKMSK